MAASAYRAQFVALAQSAARGVELALRDDATSDAVARQALERLGDLARLETDGPEALRAWAADAREDLLADCVLAAAAEAQHWSIPQATTIAMAIGQGDTANKAVSGQAPSEEAAEHDLAPDASAFGFVLQRRDETASLVHAVTRLMLQRGRSPSTLAGWTDLLDSLRLVDERIAAAIPEALVHQLLGLRLCLQHAGDWSMHLAATQPSRSAEATEGAANELDDLQLPTGFGEPDDALVFDYVQSGALSKYVERYAEAHADFADDLASTIDGLKAEGEIGNALAPRRWRALHAREANTALRFEVPPLALAAADSSTGEALVKLELGLLPALAAEVDAALSLSGGMWTLTLEVGRGELVRVALNDAELKTASADGSWTLRAAHTGSDVRLRIEDSTGAMLEETLRVEPKVS